MTTGAIGPKAAVFKGGRRVDDRRVIKFGRTEGRVVRLVGRMPFVSSREVSDLLGLDGYQRARVIMENLEALGHVTSLKTAGVYSGGWEVKRFALTVKGIGRLAELERIEVPDALKRYPVSLQWRRVLLRRLEALEVYYTAASRLLLVVRARLPLARGRTSVGRGISPLARRPGGRCSGGEGLAGWMVRLSSARGRARAEFACFGWGLPGFGKQYNIGWGRWCGRGRNVVSSGS